MNDDIMGPIIGIIFLFGIGFIIGASLFDGEADLPAEWTVTDASGRTFYGAVSVNDGCKLLVTDAGGTVAIPLFSVVRMERGTEVPR